jgi:hypothetical protein
MSGDSSALAENDALPCCGHPWQLHTPACRYWYPGTKVEAPQECGCDGAALPSDVKPADDPRRSHAASAPAR